MRFWGHESSVSRSFVPRLRGPSCYQLHASVLIHSSKL